MQCNALASHCFPYSYFNLRIWPTFSHPNMIHYMGTPGGHMYSSLEMVESYTNCNERVTQASRRRRSNQTNCIKCSAGGEGYKIGPVG